MKENNICANVINWRGGWQGFSEAFRQDNSQWETGLSEWQPFSWRVNLLSPTVHNLDFVLGLFTSWLYCVSQKKGLSVWVVRKNVFSESGGLKAGHWEERLCETIPGFNTKRQSYKFIYLLFPDPCFQSTLHRAPWERYNAFPCHNIEKNWNGGERPPDALLS